MLTKDQVRLQLDGNKTTFLPGHIIQGHLSLLLKDEVNIAILRTRFTGKITVKVDAAGNTNHLFREAEDYINGTSSLEAREHVFPFAFRVPPTSLPPTFETDFGSIKYEIEAIAMQYGCPRISISIPITVPTSLDASSRQYSKEIAVERNGYKGFDSLLRKVTNLFTRNEYQRIEAADTYKVKVSIARMAYSCEGKLIYFITDIVPLYLEIISETPQSRHGYFIERVCLKQHVKYGSGEKVRARTERMHVLNYEEILNGNSKKIIRQINFPIPNQPIMDGDIQTTLINVTHSFQVLIRSLKPFSKRVKVCVPVIIGGFSFMLFDQNLVRRSIDTLPVYTGSEDELNTSEGGQNYCCNEDRREER